MQSAVFWGAFCLQEFPEAVEVMLFYQVGELFQSYAVGRSSQSITALMDIRPDYANIERDCKLEPFSYTHLDVYKRQASICWRRWAQSCAR